MSYSEAGNPRLSNLTALVENIVEEVLGKKLNNVQSWMVNKAQVSSRLSSQNTSVREGSNQVFGAIERFGNVLSNLEKWYKNNGKSVAAKNSEFGNIAGIAGVIDAYQSADPIGGALAGLQFGPVGAAVGLLAGLFGKPKTIDEWNRPKFTKAKQAYETQFVLDRGEQDLYYLPDSFYFRSGANGRRKIVVKIGNEQLDNHIQESLTNAYASQLQRGLVF